MGLDDAATTKFRAALETLINGYCAENGSNTPDFILADFLQACLVAFDAGVNRRELWYRRPPQLIGGPTPPPGGTA